MTVIGEDGKELARGSGFKTTGEYKIQTFYMRVIRAFKNYCKAARRLQCQIAGKVQKACFRTNNISKVLRFHLSIP